ncbi:MAG: YdcH family protein [Pseudomonadota bacterium]
MSLTSHISELRKKHEHLATVIETAERQPATDHLRLTELKREKLRLKDEIARLSQQLVH